MEREAYENFCNSAKNAIEESSERVREAYENICQTAENAKEEVSEKVGVAYENFCETAENAKEATAAAAERALDDLKEVVKSLEEETEKVKTEIYRFEDDVVANKMVLYFGALLGAMIGGFVVYGLYLAHRAYVDGTG